jgi:hypothetical protein
MTELSNYVATLPDGQERLFPDKFSPKRWENVRRNRGFGGPNGLQGMVPRLAVQVDVPGMMNALVESLDGYEFEFLDSAKKSLQRFGENKVGEVISTLTFAENGVEIAIDADLCLLRMVPMEE